MARLPRNRAAQKENSHKRKKEAEEPGKPEEAKNSSESSGSEAPKNPSQIVLLQGRVDAIDAWMMNFHSGEKFSILAIERGEILEALKKIVDHQTFTETTELAEKIDELLGDPARLTLLRRIFHDSLYRGGIIEFSHCETEFSNSPIQSKTFSPLEIKELLENPISHLILSCWEEHLLYEYECFFSYHKGFIFSLISLWGIIENPLVWGWIGKIIISLGLFYIYWRIHEKQLPAEALLPPKKEIPQPSQKGIFSFLSPSYFSWRYWLSWLSYIILSLHSRWIRLYQSHVLFPFLEDSSTKTAEKVDYFLLSLWMMEFSSWLPQKQYILLSFLVSLPLICFLLESSWPSWKNPLKIVRRLISLGISIGLLYFSHHYWWTFFFIAFFYPYLSLVCLSGIFLTIAIGFPLINTLQGFLMNRFFIFHWIFLIILWISWIFYILYDYFYLFSWESGIFYNLFWTALEGIFFILLTPQVIGQLIALGFASLSEHLMEMGLWKCFFHLLLLLGLLVISLGILLWEFLWARKGNLKEKLRDKWNSWKSERELNQRNKKKQQQEEEREKEEKKKQQANASDEPTKGQGEGENSSSPAGDASGSGKTDKKREYKTTPTSPPPATEQDEFERFRAETEAGLKFS